MTTTNPSPLRAIRKNCLDCCGGAKAVAYCTCTDCSLWLLRFGKRPATVLKTLGAAMVTPQLMPDADTPLEELPQNPADWCRLVDGKQPVARG